jgi:RHS repeat-associated protein
MKTQLFFDLTGTFHTYQWDANGHVTANDGSTFTYDVVGDMAEASCGDQYLYDADGRLLAGSHSQASAYFAHIPLPGWAIAGYGNGSLTEYKHGDWMGSVRFSSTPARALNYDLAFAPFGEPYASSHIGNIFASMEQIAVADEYDTHFREYHTTQGRWISPDPVGLAAVDPSNPQSWNRYAYVVNNPLGLIDPFGTDSCPPGQSDNCVDVVATAPSVPTFTINLAGTFSSNPYAYNGARGNSVLGFVKHLHWPKGIKDALSYSADRSRCAAHNAISMASDFNVSQSSFLGQSLLGNDAATVTNLVLGPGQTDASMQLSVSNPTPVNLVNITAQAVVQAAPVETGGLVLAQNGAGTYYASRSAVTTFGQTVGGKVLSGVLQSASAAKVFYDSAMFIDALIVCSEDPNLK